MTREARDDRAARPAKPIYRVIPVDPDGTRVGVRAEAPAGRLRRVEHSLEEIGRLRLAAWSQRLARLEAAEAEATRRAAPGMEDRPETSARDVERRPDGPPLAAASERLRRGKPPPPEPRRAPTLETWRYFPPPRPRVPTLADFAEQERIADSQRWGDDLVALVRDGVPAGPLRRALAVERLRIATDTTDAAGRLRRTLREQLRLLALLTATAPVASGTTPDSEARP